jgi:hypothetical protein
MRWAVIKRAIHGNVVIINNDQIYAHPLLSKAGPFCKI